LTAWVIPIGAAFPDHWTIARDHGAWDLTRRAAIEPSDDVIFWLGGASVLAWVRDFVRYEPDSSPPRHSLGRSRDVALRRPVHVHHDLRGSGRRTVMGAGAGEHRGAVRAKQGAGKG